MIFSLFPFSQAASVATLPSALGIGEGQVCRTTAGAISGQQDDANTPIAHFDTDCGAHSSPVVRKNSIQRFSTQCNIVTLLAGQGILRNHWRHNNSPATGRYISVLGAELGAAK
jgi:hypothetical protein